MMAASAPPTGLSGEDGFSTPAVSAEVPQNGIKSWERVWTTQEMRKEAGNWSLAGDAGLLQYLQEFSQHIVSRTHEIGKEVDGLEHEAKLTGVRVNNVINDFIMLANTQFVENRVFDEDVSQDTSKEEEKKTEKKEKTREQREAELIPRVSNALKLGIDVIEYAFEKLDTKVVDSDSEDEEGNGIPEPILEAKDPYANRLLPYLIGTPQFMEDDNVGLTEDMSDEGESDHGSISVSGGEEPESTDSETETEYSTSEESGEIDKVKAPVRAKPIKSSSGSEESGSESEGELFGVQKNEDEEDDYDEKSESEDETERKISTIANGHGDLASELAAKIGVAVSKKPVPSGRDDEENRSNEWGDKSGQTTSSTHHQKKDQSIPVEGTKSKNEKGKGKAYKNTEDDLFGASEATEDDFLFGKSSGLFSSSKGLFDDDDDKEDEGGLFGDVTKNSSKSKKGATQEKLASFFDADDEEGEKQGDEKPAVVDTRPRTKSGKMLPKGAVSVFGIPEGPSKTDVPDIHIVKKPTPQPAVVPQKKSGGGLFDDDEEEDDLFNGFATKKPEPEKKEKTLTTKTTTATKKTDLFADDGDEDDDDLFSTMAAPGRKKSHSTIGLTVEGDEEEKVAKSKKHQEAEQLRKQITPEKKLPPGAVSMFGKEPNPLLAALKKNKPQPETDEESEEEKKSRSPSIHSNTSAMATPGPAKPVEDSLKKKTRSGSLFDDYNDDDLLSKQTSSAVDRKKEDTVSKTDKGKPAEESLLNDDSEEDFFSSTVKTSDNKKPVGAVSLFGGVDELSATNKKDSKANVAAAPAASKPAVSKATAPPAAQKSGAALFDEDEEEDDFLFSAKPSQSAGEKQNPKKSSQNLFEDDDLLFKAGEETSPTVDLFSKKGPLTKTPQKEKEPEKKASIKPAVPDLFGEESEDDLFLSSALKTKPSTAASTQPVKQSISGVTETESRDTMEVKEEEVKKPKKPAGAVSMFGGMDPTSLLKMRKPSDAEEDKTPAKEEIKKVEEKKESSKVIDTSTKEIKNVEENPSLEDKKSSKDIDTSTKEKDSRIKPTVDLFGTEEEEEDLFSPKPAVSKQIEGVTTTESKDSPTKEEVPVVSPTKPRKPAGAVSMFGGSIDPLALLKKNKKPSEDETPTKEEEPKEKAPPPEVARKSRTKSEILEASSDEEKTTPPEIATRTKPSLLDVDDMKPKPPVDLFGGEDEDEDDLFGAPKKKTPPATAPKSAVPVESHKEESEFKSPESARPKKPAGAVSMFGGLDPFAGMKKKPSFEEKEDVKEASPPLEEPPNFIDPLSVLASPVADPATTPLLASAAPKPKTTTKSTNVKSPTINPAAMLPGASHPSLGKALERSESVDFDQPAEAEVLASASKDRPKLSRRRPQSRKARVMAAGSSGISFEETTPTTPTTPTIPEVPDMSGLEVSQPTKKAGSPAKNHVAPNEQGNKSTSIDLFGNDDLIEGPSLSLVGSARESTKKEDIFTKDSFGSKSARDQTAADDLFSPSAVDKLSSGDNVQKSTAPKAGSLGHKNNLEDDDLFKASSKTKSTKVSQVLNDDDDLFSSTPTIKKEQFKGDRSSTSKPDSKPEASRGSEKSKDVLSKSSSKKHTNPLADDEDDIFADSSLGKKREPKKKLVLDDEDLFASKTDEDKKKSTKSKKAITNEDKFLNDSTDIFSDIPEVTPKETKKKVTKKATEKKTIFKDDVDDIFADTPVVTSKTKKDVKKKTTAQTVTADTDIIFDDPMS